MHGSIVASAFAAQIKSAGSEWTLARKSSNGILSPRVDRLPVRKLAREQDSNFGRDGGTICRPLVFPRWPEAPEYKVSFCESPTLGLLLRDSPPQRSLTAPESDRETLRVSRWASSTPDPTPSAPAADFGLFERPFPEGLDFPVVEISAAVKLKSQPLPQAAMGKV